MATRLRRITPCREGEQLSELLPQVLITVIIPVYQDWERLTLCIHALQHQSLSSEDYEIIIVNNEARLRYIEHLPANARLIHEPQPGSYIARNTAVASSGAKYLAFTDSDCIPHRDWLKNGLRALSEHPGGRIAGPVETFREQGSGYYAYLYDFHTAFRQDHYVKANFCATANMMVERAVFNRVGPFYDRFSGGDFEWNQRAKATGVPIVFAKDVSVQHPARANLQAILRKRRRKAGAQQDARVHRYLLGRIVAPVREIWILRRKGVTWGTTLFVAGVHSLGSCAEILEFGLVRSGLKKPNRT